MIPAHIEHTFRALDRIERREPQQPMPGSPALVEGSSPNADAGTVGVSAPHPIRFWTVRFERKGRSYYDRVEAPDAWMASKVAMARNEGATCSETVREISREDYDRFTRRSP